MYCSKEDLKGYVLDAYLEKVEELNPGGVARHIETISSEIDLALAQAGYSLPLESIPGLVKRIAAVCSAYLSVSAITSLMDNGSLSGNEWYGLQSLYKKAIADLEAIRKGSLKLFPGDSSTSGGEDNKAAVHSKKALFNSKTWERF